MWNSEDFNRWYVECIMKVDPGKVNTLASVKPQTKLRFEQLHLEQFWDRFSKDCSCLIVQLHCLNMVTEGLDFIHGALEDISLYSYSYKTSLQQNNTRDCVGAAVFFRYWWDNEIQSKKGCLSCRSQILKDLSEGKKSQRQLFIFNQGKIWIKIRINVTK